VTTDVRWEPKGANAPEVTVGALLGTPRKTGYPPTYGGNIQANAPEGTVGAIQGAHRKKRVTTDVWWGHTVANAPEVTVEALPSTPRGTG
jgi:hypothetical protein